MTDRECVAFLQEVLPRLGLRPAGYRRVRGIVRKRLGRRVRALGLADAAAYRAYLEGHPDEWSLLAELCRMPISRFYRDRDVFEWLVANALPDLARRAAARGQARVDAWSAGCASGEEPYTLAIAWRLGVARALAVPALHIVATDADAHAITRAARGCYPAGSFKELPAAWRERAFARHDEAYCVLPEFREGIAFAEQDVRHAQPEGPFDLVLCRNLAFTYFDDDGQRQALARFVARLRPGGVLVIGHKEDLPAGEPGLVPLDAQRRVFAKPTS